MELVLFVQQQNVVFDFFKFLINSEVNRAKVINGVIEVLYVCMCACPFVFCAEDGK